MRKLKLAVRRLAYVYSAAVLGLVALASLATPAPVAAAQVTSRSIQMSNSSPSATASSVTYKISWTAQTTSTIKSLVVDFCSNSPIVGDTTCTAPTGFSVGTPTVANPTNIGSWTASSLNSGRTFTYSDATGSAMTANVTAVSFEITTVTNPTSAAGTFYARIYTYAGQTDAASYTPASPGSYVDSGGFALSTANQITVTAKVQETLTFCAFVTGTACSGSSGTAVTLGDANGVLSNLTSGYTSTSKVSLASNAQSGVTVRVKGATLTSGANTITALTTCAADSTSSTVDYYGMRVSSAGSGQTAAAPFNCSAGNHGFDATNMNTTYGATILTTSTANDESASTIEYAAKAATTSKAGVYTSTLTYIATGVY